jgi:predicted  nucleic acid-binding Zn-ribbon protein
MGPTNIALVKLFRADQNLRTAQERYDTAAQSVRLLERKVADLTAKLTASQKTLREQQATAGNMDLDLKTREAHIEKLRTQQQQAKTNKEYQVFLTEINTEKVDRNRVEEEAIGALEVVERTQWEVTALQGQLDEEQKMLTEVKAQLDGKLSKLQVKIDQLRPARDAAYEAVPARAREQFDRLAEEHEGEEMSPVEKPDGRLEEYVCGTCRMPLNINLFNRLQSQDKVEPCPSCGRLLFIPAFVFREPLRPTFDAPSEGSPLSLYFDLDEFTPAEIADILTKISEMYVSVGGDELVIDDTTIMDYEVALVPVGGDEGGAV